eukprot:CAMPEP_0195056152 /NCGR_PEP_ID=MMETSP0448-20130528/4677_1 /TAXON_ID=66468 /ORGANISM="Heterocapsa triquestra, Strain CCMP 448" /LENGTH=203 /DNA_ID=CAMNT_0040085951 /DNA_START=107 /DNA_END=715 /DNA_ORIENTATION=+
MAYTRLAIALALAPVLARGASSGGRVSYSDGTPIIDFADVSDEYVAMLMCLVPLLLTGLISLAFVGCLSKGLMSKKTGIDIGVPKLDYLAAKVKSGSIAFLKEEYKYLTVYVVVWAIVVAVLFTIVPIVEGKSDDGVRAAACMITGSFLSALAGWIGMRVATEGNVRTTVACASGTLNDGLKVAFTAGAAMGFGVVGLAATGI